jgi:hypothetical protein
MQTINEARAAKFSVSVARVAGGRVATPSIMAGPNAAWRLLVKKFVANLLLALAAPAY